MLQLLRAVNVSVGPESLYQSRRHALANRRASVRVAPDDLDRHRIAVRRGRDEPRLAPDLFRREREVRDGDAQPRRAPDRPAPTTVSPRACRPPGGTRLRRPTPARCSRTRRRACRPRRRARRARRASATRPRAGGPAAAGTAPRPATSSSPPRARSPGTPGLRRATVRPAARRVPPASTHARSPRSRPAEPAREDQHEQQPEPAGEQEREREHHHGADRADVVDHLGARTDPRWQIRQDVEDRFLEPADVVGAERGDDDDERGAPSRTKSLGRRGSRLAARRRTRPAPSVGARRR